MNLQPIPKTFIDKRQSTYLHLKHDHGGIPVLLINNILFIKYHLKGRVKEHALAYDDHSQTVFITQRF